MSTRLTIGMLAQRTGVSPKTIRFYEAAGILPPPRRNPSGYRLFSEADVRRLRLLHHARVLGVSLAEAKTLAERAFASDCLTYGRDLLAVLVRQRAALDQRIAELTALRDELDELEAHIHHDQARVRPGQRVAARAFCPLLDEEGGEMP